MATLIQKIEKVTGKSANIINNQSKTGGVPRLVADISKAKKLLGFKPNVSLKDGLEKMLAEDGRF